MLFHVTFAYLQLSRQECGSRDSTLNGGEGKEGFPYFSEYRVLIFEVIEDLIVVYR